MFFVYFNVRMTRVYGVNIIKKSNFSKHVLPIILRLQKRIYNLRNIDIIFIYLKKKLFANKTKN